MATPRSIYISSSSSSTLFHLLEPENLQSAMAEVAGGKKECCGNIVLFPMLAHGHMNPFMGLAHLLLSRQPNLTLTIVSTPVNIHNLRTLFPSNPSVRFAELPFCTSDHGLPPDAENTLTLSRADISSLFRATQSFQPAFHRLISDLHSTSDGPPLLSIVSNMFLSWSVDVARAFGLHHAVLYTSGPYAMCIYYSIWLHLPHAHTSADEIPVPDLPGVTVHRSQPSALVKAAGTAGSTSAVADPTRRSGTRLLFSRGRVSRSGSGPPGNARGRSAHSTSLETDSAPEGHFPASQRRRALRGWIGARCGRSCTSRSDPSAASGGLEASGRPFVWTIRPPLGCDFGVAEEEWDLELPDGFEERMREEERGLLIRMWAPQLEILGHQATGAFLSHCGWNSVLESTVSSVPVIAWPLAAEQFYNAKLLAEELGVGVEMARGEEEMIEEGDVVRVLEEVFEGERGREMRKRAEDLKEELRRALDVGGDEVGKEKGSSIGALDEFLQAVVMRSGPSA